MNGKSKWSEWQDSNLRPLRPERAVSLCASLNNWDFRRVHCACAVLFTGFLSRFCPDIRSATSLWKSGWWWPYTRSKQLRAHAEIAGRVPDVGALLHRPGRRRVPADVRRDVAIDLGRLGRRSERLPYRRHRLAVPFDYGMTSDAQPLPAPQVSQQSGRQPNRRLSLVRLAGALAAPVEHTAVRIDVAASDRRLSAQPSRWRHDGCPCRSRPA